MVDTRSTQGLPRLVLTENASLGPTLNNDILNIAGKFRVSLNRNEAPRSIHALNSAARRRTK